jgi:hypothetical protein
MPKFAALLLLCTAIFAQQKGTFTDTRDGKTKAPYEATWMKSADKAINLLGDLYKSHMGWGKELDFGNKKETSKYFSSEMVELLYLEEKCLKETGEICRINWVILCNCQDYSDKFSVKFETKSAKPIQILAKISDSGEKSEILFDFVEENGMLKISDMLRSGEYSLRGILKEAYP